MKYFRYFINFKNIFKNLSLKEFENDTEMSTGKKVQVSIWKKVFFSHDEFQATDGIAKHFEIKTFACK